MILPRGVYKVWHHHDHVPLLFPSLAHYYPLPSSRSVYNFN